MKKSEIIKQAAPGKKYIIHTLAFDQLDRHRQFEIRLPGNIKKVTGVIITTSFKELGG